MISIAHFKKIIKDSFYKIISLDIIPCPICGGELFTRSTCHRFAINPSGIKDHYLLRILQCRDCRRTHRELPAPLVPYKRYDGGSIVAAVNEPEKAPCDFRTTDLLRKWLAWFIVYANHIREGQSLLLSTPLPKISGIIQCSELLALVRIVANTGNWSHNRTELSCV